jgi:hypothetical protein
MADNQGRRSPTPKGYIPIKRKGGVKPKRRPKKNPNGAKARKPTVNPNTVAKVKPNAAVFKKTTPKPKPFDFKKTPPPPKDTGPDESYLKNRKKK